jgi:hypothetical protein
MLKPHTHNKQRHRITNYIFPETTMPKIMDEVTKLTWVIFEY